MLNSHKKYLFLSSFFFIFSCLVFTFLYKQIDLNKQILKDTEQKWRIEIAKQNDSKALDNSMNQLMDDKILIDTHFADTYSIVPFLDKIEQMASDVSASAEVFSVDQPVKNEVGVNDISFDPLTNKPVANFSKENGLFVGIKVEGSFGAIYKFINLLENAVYEIEILSMDIKKEGIDEKNNQIWSGVLKIRLISFIP